MRRVYGLLMATVPPALGGAILFYILYPITVCQMLTWLLCCAVWGWHAQKIADRLMKRGEK